ncbi:MAG: TolC family protein [Alphaproteobacteria bacterium]|nr:TolC family protein [Alphaproteobacteria bacterium]
MIALLLALSVVTAAELPPDIPDTYAGAVSGLAPAGPWWQSFADPGLSQVVEAGLSANGDLGAFDARVRQSQALARQSLAPLMPSASFDVSASSSPRSVRCAQFAAQLGGDSGASQFLECDDEGWYTQGSALFKGSWSLDIWGAGVQGFRASRFDALATAGDRDAQAIALATRIAQAWYDVEATRRQVEILTTQASISADLLELIEARYERGDAAAAEVLQQRQQLAATRAQLPQARAQLRGLEMQLSVLTGKAPGAVALPASRGVLPDLPPAPATGHPSDLVDARPDLRALALDVSAAEARRKAAVRTSLPTLGATASAGWQTADLSLDDPVFETATVGAALSVPILQGGRNLAAVQAARAAEDAARLSFEQGVRLAVSEVESALVREAELVEVLDLMREQETVARQSFEDIRARYQGGVARYVDLLTALNAWQTAQLSAVNAQRELLRTRIDLHDALGGAWVADLSLEHGEAR